MTRLAASILLLTATLTPAAASGFAPIPVTVREPAGVARQRWPLTISVPFPRGELPADAVVRVAADSGGVDPAQAKPLVLWSDGSVRWLLVDTQIDLSPRGERQLRVELGEPATPAAAVRAIETAEEWEIDTGVIQFTVPKKRFAIIDRLRWAGGRRALVGPVGALLAADGGTGRAQPPERVEMLERGPLRLRLELGGSYGNGFDYLVRLEAYAGQSFVRVWHTFVDRGGSAYTDISRIAVELPLPGATRTHYRYGVTGTPGGAGELGDGGLALFQADNTTYAVNGKKAPGRLAGWIELGDREAAVGVAARSMWEEYPQSFEARRNRLAYNLWAPEAEPALSGLGAAKTHEFVIWVSAPAEAAIGAALGRPLVAVVDPAWIARSGALPEAISPNGPSGPFARRAAEAARRYKRRNEIEKWEDCRKVRCEAAGRERTGAFGMWNWGDWNFPGYRDTTKGTDSWGNLEYDTAYVLGLTYAASGDPEVHEMMAAAARHFIDVDTIHAYPPHPEWVGMNHPKNPLHFSFELGGPDLGHTWTQGSLAYYYLTGDERGLDAARGVADYLVRRLRSVMAGNPRQWGWPQIALLAVYDATGERTYLDAALAYARGGMRAHAPAISTDWKLGILADALAYTHAATGDAEIKSWLDEYVAATMKRQATADSRAFPAVAYMAALTGNPALREAARQRVDRIDPAGWGKPFSISGRIGFRIESLLAAPPPPAVTAPPVTPSS